MPNTIGAKKINMYFISKQVIENTYQPGSTIGAQSRFVRNILNKRAARKKDNTPYLTLCNRLN